MKKIDLDEWDYRLIDGCKSCNFTLDQAKQIWSKRNCIDPEFVDVVWLLKEMMDIVLATNPNVDIFQMVLDAGPDNRWKFVVSGKKEEYNYLDAWFSVLTSRIALTKICNISGYQEWIDSH